jgi:hypothetical protein
VFFFYSPPARTSNLARQHLPTRVGERNDCIHAYVRALQGVDIPWDWVRLRVAFKHWWHDAEWIVGTKDEWVSWSDYVRAWQSCSVPVGGLDHERLRETSANVPLPPGAERFGEGLRTLMRACIKLGLVNGNGEFFLSRADAARLCGVSEARVYQYFSKLIERGFLEQLSVGNSVKQEANRYRWLKGS